MLQNNNAVNEINTTEVIQEDTDNQDNDYMTYVSDEFAKELIEVGKGIQDGSQFFSAEVNAKIWELFDKITISPAEKANDILNEIFRIAGLPELNTI